MTTIVLSMVVFVVTLVSIATYNPGVGNKAAAPVQAQHITIVQSSGSAPLVLAPPPRVSAVRPLTRSRGS